MDLDQLHASSEAPVPTLRELHHRNSWVSIATAGVLIVTYFAQLVLAPSPCVGEPFVANCAAEALLSYSEAGGVLLLPFLHRDALHLISNVVVLLVLGVGIERWNSSGLFLGLFLLGSYLSIGIDVLGTVSGPRTSYAIGASGATRTLAGFFVVELFLPRTKISVRGVELFRLPAPRLSTPLTLVVPVVAVSLTMLSMGQFVGLVSADQGIAVVGHVVGTAFGVGAGLYLRQR